MSARRIRVHGVHADFITPRGWPTPTDAWIRANGFWQPPADWAPLPGLRSAPEGWRFWALNTEGERASASLLRPVTVWSRLGTWAVLGFLSFGLLSALLHEPMLRWGSVASAIAVTTSLVITLSTYVKRRRFLRAKLAEAGAEQRAERLTKAYQSYLRDAS